MSKRFLIILIATVVIIAYIDLIDSTKHINNIISTSVKKEKINAELIKISQRKIRVEK